MTRIKNMKAFTLIELIVVVVIIGILALMAAVAYNKFVTSANAASAEGSVKIVGDFLQASSVQENALPNSLLADADVAAAVSANGVTVSEDNVTHVITITKTIGDSTSTYTMANEIGAPALD